MTILLIWIVIALLIAAMWVLIGGAPYPPYPRTKSEQNEDRGQ